MKTDLIELQKPQQQEGGLLSKFAPSFIVVFVLTAMISCSNEDEADPDADFYSPGYHIATSEKLAIPVEIDLPNSGNTRIATYYARGVQIYHARQKAGTNPPVYEWVFASPSAILFSDKNVQVGTHFAGPSWRLLSGGLINGQQFTPAKTKSMNPGSIDWLLLMPKEGSTPTGIFKDVSYIQRIATTGGKAPTTPPASASETIGVEYTAVYRFTKSNQ